MVGSCPRAGLGALPGVGLSPGAVLGNVSRQFIRNSSQALFDQKQCSTNVFVLKADLMR